MELRALKLFLTVYECRNISAAADRLGMNQPAVSKAVQRIEVELGVSLFEREPRGVAPTLFANMLFDAAREVDSNLNAVIRRISAMRDGSVGEVVVGAGGTWQEVLLPKAVARLTQRSPRARIRIVPASVEELVAGLIRGEIDLALAPIDIPGAMTSKVCAEPLLVSELAVIARGDHPLRTDEPLTLAKLACQRWILPPGPLIRDRFERGFRIQNIEPPLPVIECFDSSCLLQIVESTDLLTYLADLRLRPRLHMNLARLPANPLNIHRNTGLILRRSSYVPPLAKELIAEVRAVCAEAGFSPDLKGA
ncbi:LysR family transcriptional regulator [Pararhizobium sp. IMCC21322]|uniref:LysR family transcriptional regulator n=1 Tax=Pararhizobium sp. IMCC21322 TaxID=3067903 RepID=UPI00274119C9|nr:LysR family transcriptional regulator [Pararhizobium sp. IMCC21322]